MGLLETSLEVVKLAGKVANPELVQAATRANIEALELSTRSYELQKAVTQLEGRIAELEAKLVLQGEVFRHRDLVFREGDRDPYCSRCWDVDRNLIHVMRGAMGVTPKCPECRTQVLRFYLNPRMPPEESPIK